MSRTARRTVIAATAVALAALLGACQASPATAPASTVHDTAPPAAASAAPVAARATAFPGTLSVLTIGTGKPITLTRAGETTQFGTAGAGDILAQPSYDGRHLVLISSPDTGNVTPGDLVVVDAGGRRHVLAHNVAWGGGAAPAWHPDGTAVIHNGVRYEVPGGTRAPLGLGTADYLVYSASGTAMAYTSTERSIKVLPAGAKARSVDISKFPECEQSACPFAVQAVSDGGDYVALGRGNTDPSHVTDTLLVLDTRTGKRVDLGAFPQLQHVWFTAGGGAIIADGKGLQVVDGSWHVTGNFPAPAAGELFYTA